MYHIESGQECPSDNLLLGKFLQVQFRSLFQIVNRPFNGLSLAHCAHFWAFSDKPRPFLVDDGGERLRLHGFREKRRNDESCLCKTHRDR